MQNLVTLRWPRPPAPWHSRLRPQRPAPRETRWRHRGFGGAGRRGGGRRGGRVGFGTGGAGAVFLRSQSSWFWR